MLSGYKLYFFRIEYEGWCGEIEVTVEDGTVKVIAVSALFIFIFVFIVVGVAEGNGDCLGKATEVVFGFEGEEVLITGRCCFFGSFWHEIK